VGVRRADDPNPGGDRFADVLAAQVEAVGQAVDLQRDPGFQGDLEDALEVNGLPDRLDLSGEHVRDAIAAGVRIVCSTDAHSVRGLENMTFSVMTARRGWATAADVLNTRPLRSVLACPGR
jgi:DNA polymerase (family 10)